MFIQRNTYLNNLCGWYKFKLTDEIARLWNEYNNNQIQMKFGRFLSKKGLSSNEIERISNIVSSQSVKISGNKKDFDRLAKSRHYDSCLGGYKSGQIEKFYYDPDISICYVPDRSGSYLYRFLLRLVMVDGIYGLVAYKPYGNGNQTFIVDNLRKILDIPIWFAAMREHKNNKYVFSPTKYKNIGVVYPTWSDHSICFRGGKMGILIEDYLCSQ